MKVIRKQVFVCPPWIARIAPEPALDALNIQGVILYLTRSGGGADGHPVDRRDQGKRPLETVVRVLKGLEGRLSRCAVEASISRQS